ncbi:PH domain-containing protein [Xylariomycetidae sp. FL2044]|nr:PH domain-containing protein [Xylariomycetidae sp. FL2044]
MAETATQCLAEATGTRLPGRGATLSIPSCAITTPLKAHTSRLRSQFGLTASSPVNQNGSFEFDRVIKSGHTQKRTQKTKAWKHVYLVLRPNTLSIYKSEKESNLRHQIYLSDLSAVTLLKDPKGKRHNLFGLFSPARNYHFEAPSARDAQQWVELIRRDARIEEEEEEMFLASPIVRRQSFSPAAMLKNKSTEATNQPFLDKDGPITGSPEPVERPVSKPVSSSARRPSQNDYSGVSGNELGSQSDLSDIEASRAHGPSIDSLQARSTLASPSAVQLDSSSKTRPIIGSRNASQLSGLNIEQDPDRVVWQGWLWFLKGKRGMRKWKNCWAVLRPRNLILYKDESEYTASFILSLSTVLNVVDIDPVSKTKTQCLQVITDEKGYRFCAHNEESLVHCLGAFKSLLSKRKELEARVAASSSVGNVAPTTATSTTTPVR